MDIVCSYKYLATNMAYPMLEQPQILDLTHHTEALRLACGQSGWYANQRHDIPRACGTVPSIDPQGTQGYNSHLSTMRTSSDIRVLVLRWLPRRVGSQCCPFVTKPAPCPARKPDESESAGIKPKDGELSELSLFCVESF